MANTTIKGAESIHGTNPQFLIDKVLRSRIYDSQYWKESCFALTAESLIDRAIKDVKFIGSTCTSNLRPIEFLCLLLKLLQLQPEKEIILEYLRAEEFKYLRALAAFYVRLTFTPLNVYQTLEPLLVDYRKLRVRELDGSFTLTTFDQFIDQLLTESIVLQVVLPRLTSRKVLEEMESLQVRKSTLAIALGLDSDHSDKSHYSDKSDDEEEISKDRLNHGYQSNDPDISHSPIHHPAQSPTSSNRFISPSPSTDRFISRSPSPDRFISRSPTPQVERIEGDMNGVFFYMKCYIGRIIFDSN
ncbi:hypothetical protein O181_051836 [Austropuccinia psidii MF-1]|uniref:Pre-mRNA-splicing factor 38 n=1 Tax=Austropuccinia psidii MF-1 TaxID=1389203 RepID=A0A9Q3E4G8_9BASI|nr:hypothetical protein [Austropuccinia psidii MF-1]